MYAVIKTGGKQYRVVEDQEIVVESLDQKPGEKVLFDEVLLIKKDEKILARPADLKGAAVEGVVIEHLRGEKIEGFKYRPKKRQRKRFGHRQELTKVKIVKISLPGEKPEEKPKVKKATPKKAEEAKEKKKEVKKEVVEKAAAKPAETKKTKAQPKKETKAKTEQKEKEETKKNGTAKKGTSRSTK